MSRIGIVALTLAVSFSLGHAALAGGGGNFVAHLNGANEMPPFDTQAQGQFIAQHRGGDLSYKLIVANLQNVVAAHIHCAPEGVNGPVGVTLFAGSPVTISGILASCITFVTFQSLRTGVTFGTSSSGITLSSCVTFGTCSPV